MLSPGGKLRQSVQSAAESIRTAAQGTGQLVMAALLVAGIGLVVALAALLGVVKLRKAATV